MSLYSDLMAKSVGQDDHRQRIERVTEAADWTALPNDALPNDSEDSAFEDGDLQRSDADDPSQFAHGDDHPFEDDHTDLWDVFLTDGDWAEPEPERGDFWLDGL